MSRQARKRVLIGLLVVVLALFVAGGVAAWVSRNDTICSDGKAPLFEQGAALGQKRYLCHDGEVVTK
jgi:hypothetical protein